MAPTSPELLLCAARQVMRLDLDFTAQVLGYLFEVLDKIIADARSPGTRSALLEPSDLQTFLAQFGAMALSRC
jgi:hypothetical protein